MNITKRFIAAFLALSVLCGMITLFPTKTAIYAEAAEAQTLTVTGDSVNVRSGAGTSYSKVTVVLKGATYTVLGSEKDSSGTVWYKISAGGKTGYIISTYVKVTAPSTGSTTQTLTVTGTSVNVRSGAGTSYSKVTVVQKGATYTVLGSAKDSSGTVWYKISVSGKTGYIISTYAKVTSASTGSAAQTLTVTGETVNVRSGAGADYDFVALAKKGEKYTVLGSSKDAKNRTWYKISIKGKTGYIIETYVTVSTVATSAATTTTTTTTTTKATTTTAAGGSQKVTVTGSSVNVRSGPGTSYSKITVVQKGATYAVLGSAKDSSGKVWYKISVSGKTGYIISTYVKVTAVTTTAATTTTTSATQSGTITQQRVTVTGSSVNVRSGAGTSYSKVTVVQKGATYTVLGSAKDSSGKVWYKIKVGKVTGYIISTYVKVSTVTVTTTTAAPTTTTASTTTTTTASTTTTTTSAATTTSTAATTTPTAASNQKTITVGTVKTSSGTLNVRSGAGTSYSVKGTLASGKQVTIVQKLSGWYKIEYGSGYGYVSSSYITNVTTKVVTVSIAFAKEYYYVNLGSTVSVAVTGSGSSVTYTSENSDAAPVDSKGTVTGKKAGLYTITAQYGNLTAQTEVVVLKAANTGVSPMTISEAGTDFIAQWEGGGTALAGVGTVFYPYKDVSGYWTVGYGHAKTTTESKSWSTERAIAEFNTDITKLIGGEHIITDEKPYLTLEEAQALLNADLNDGPYVAAVSNWAVRNGVKLTQQQFDSLVSFCYNLGPSYWTSDTMYFYLKSAIIAHRSGSDAVPTQIIEGFCRYIKSGGVSLKGLWWRRRNEAEMFIEGDYAIDRENKFTLPTDIQWG